MNNAIYTQNTCFLKANFNKKVGTSNEDIDEYLVKLRVCFSLNTNTFTI